MILNLTQHRATPDQIEAGVVELPQESQQILKELLTFESAPSKAEIVLRAIAITKMAKFIPQGMSIPCDFAMVGGAPYLMGALCGSLWAQNITPRFSFTERRSVEETLPDGSVRKSSVFVHLGWVTAPDWDFHPQQGCSCGCA